MGDGAVFKQVDPLPGAKGHFAMDDGNGEAGVGEGRADVGGHVVGAFQGVAIVLARFRDEALEEVAEVEGDVGVGVLLDH